MSQYQKGTTNLDFTEARDSEWQCRQLGCMQVCTSLQTDNHASTPPLFTGRIPFLPPNQQRQSTEGHVALQLYHSNNFSCLPQRSVEWTNSGNVTVQMHCVLHELTLIGFQSDSFQ